jgi:hypothetical protein
MRMGLSEEIFGSAKCGAVCLRDAALFGGPSNEPERKQGEDGSGRRRYHHPEFGAFVHRDTQPLADTIVVAIDFVNGSTHSARRTLTATATTQCAPSCPSSETVRRSHPDTSWRQKLSTEMQDGCCSKLKYFSEDIDHAPLRNAQFSGCAKRQIEDTTRQFWSPVIDRDNYRFACHRVSHANSSAEGQVAVGSG